MPRESNEGRTGMCDWCLKEGVAVTPVGDYEGTTLCASCVADMEEAAGDAR